MLKTDCRSFSTWTYVWATCSHFEHCEKRSPSQRSCTVRAYNSEAHILLVLSVNYCRRTPYLKADMRVLFCPTVHQLHTAVHYSPPVQSQGHMYSWPELGTGCCDKPLGHSLDAPDHHNLGIKKETNNTEWNKSKAKIFYYHSFSAIFFFCTKSKGNTLSFSCPKQSVLIATAIHPFYG